MDEPNKLTPAEMEAYVRERWDSVRFITPGWCQVGGITPWRRDSSRGWSAAYTFTLEREKQIAEVREETWWLENYHLNNAWEEPIVKRILAREQAALEELLRGMK